MYKIEAIKIFIENVFNEYFLKYNLVEDKSISELNPYKCAYKNLYCTFIFSIDYTEVDLKVQKLGDDYLYSIFSIYHYLKGGHFDTKVDPICSLEDLISKPLIAFRNYIETDLPELPVGDFSWAKKVREGLEQNEKNWAKLMSLDNKHPIYIKHENNDPSWETDIIRLLDEETRKKV